MRILAFLTVGMVFGWFYALKVYNYLEEMVKANMPSGVTYEAMITTLPGGFMLEIKMAFFIGLFLALPFTVHQVWGFVAPGLKPNEKKPIKVLAPISTALFFIGCWMCWWILPPTIRWFGSFMVDFKDTKLMLEAGSMVFLLIKMMLSFGLGFQMPILVFFLARLEIVTPEAMLRYWRHAVVSVVIASAMITPSGDPLSMSVMAAPLIALFFISVFAARYTLKRSKSKDDEELDHLD